jgi:hypothetical protein
MQQTKFPGITTTSIEGVSSRELIRVNPCKSVAKAVSRRSAACRQQNKVSGDHYDLDRRGFKQELDPCESVQIRGKSR